MCHQGVDTSEKRLISEMPRYSEAEGVHLRFIDTDEFYPLQRVRKISNVKMLNNIGNCHKHAGLWLS